VVCQLMHHGDGDVVAVVVSRGAGRLHRLTLVSGRGAQVGGCARIWGRGCVVTRQPMLHEDVDDVAIVVSSGAGCPCPWAGRLTPFLGRRASVWTRAGACARSHPCDDDDVVVVVSLVDDGGGPGWCPVGVPG